MASTLKDTYSAYDFAFGVNPAATGALQVVSGSTTAGTYTITCSPAQIASADGKLVTLSIYTPITIGGGASVETVTPTAVSVNGLNQVLITAAFTYAHSVGAQVRSGSAGVAEAAAYAQAQGGGMISLNQQWFAAIGIAVTGKAALNTYFTSTIKAPGLLVAIQDASGSTGSTVGTNAAISWLGAAAGSSYTQGIRIY